jgi:alkylated DNA repair dioxygenase AlkB
MNILLEDGSIRLIREFLPDSANLYQELVDAISWDSRMRARKAASFGVPYNYSGIEWPAAPFPTLLLPILERVTATFGFIPNNCLAHFYPDANSTMGFHFDATNDLEPGTGIAVVSFGAERAITFRKIDRTATEIYRLPSGSLLWMSPEMQTLWTHAILADACTTGGRVSLTFRQMKG